MLLACGLKRAGWGEINNGFSVGFLSVGFAIVFACLG